jgi:KaiC/GvpD/RAD55 family RecA-like ATPase
MRGSTAVRGVPRSRLPRELEQFVRKDNFMLFIRGAAGTGKTSLALTILNALGAWKNCLYISTTTSPEQIFRHYPWLETLSSRRELGRMQKPGFSAADLPAFVDAKLEDREGIFEIITSKLMDAQAPTIVVDSWDAIDFSKDREAVFTNLRVLHSWIQRASAKLILIKEQVNDIAIDTLADGVVILKQDYYNDRRIREIEFLKLSGIQVNKPSHFYTLNNSIFTSFAPHSPGDFAPASRNPARKAKKPAREERLSIATGQKKLDSLLGKGVSTGGIVNIELDPDVNPAVPFILLDKTISNFVDADNLVLFLPLDGTSPRYVDRFRNDEVPDFEVQGKSREAETSRVVTVEQPSAGLDVRLAAFQKTLARMRNAHPDKLMLSIIGADVAKSAEGKVAHVEQLMTLLRSSADLTIIINRRSRETAGVAGISDVYLKIIDVKGTLFLQPQKPWSGLYAITINKQRVRLDPVV